MAPDSGTTWPIGLLGVKALADKFKRPNVVAITVSMTNFGFITFSIARLRCDESRYVFDDFFVVADQVVDARHLSPMPRESLATGDARNCLRLNSGVDYDYLTQ